MKKTGLVLILLLALFSVTVGVEVTNEVDAATYLSSGVGIMSPTNSTYSPSLLTLNTLVIGLGGSNIDYSMAYSLDGKGNVTFPIAIQTHDRSFQLTISGSATLPELSEGSHNITVYEKIEINTSAPSTLWDSNTVYFTIDDGNPPITTNLSLENKTYSQNELSLNFTVDEPCSWIGYCLDGRDNVTVEGNTTLTGLPSGSHNITVYANDTFGNMGASQTTTFTVAKPQSTPISTIAAVSGVIALIIVAGLLVYFKKHKFQSLTISTKGSRSRKLRFTTSVVF